MASEDHGALEFNSALPGMVWPAVLRPRRAMVLGWQFQLEQSQWLPPDQIQACQRRQLTLLLNHAQATSPFHRPRLEAAGWRSGRELTEELWRQLPLMTRTDWQQAGDDLYSTAVPSSHGQVMKLRTSGSTGQPIQISTTALAQELGQTFNLRDLLWHRRNLRGKLATIRFAKADEANYPQGKEFPNWGMGPSLTTGPAVTLAITTGVHHQAEWLVRHNPHYLMTYPSNLLVLCQHFQEQRLSLPKLKEVWTFGELLEPGVRQTVRDVWSVPLTDLYSSQEVNNIALQCPQEEAYHVQEENVRLEVLDAHGQPCAPGQIGRVVVTSLHNFATPIVRYALGDYAEVMGPCACGRGLMALRRIVGRARNVFTLPTGEQRWPTPSGMSKAVPYRQFQVIQRTLHDLEVLLVMPRPLTEDDRAALKECLDKNLGYAFNVTFTCVDHIPSSPTGKYEDFRSEVPLVPMPMTNRG